MIPARFTGDRMKRFVEGTGRAQSTLFPECLKDWIDDNNPVRVIDVFVDELDLATAGSPLASVPSTHQVGCLALSIRVDAAPGL